MRLLDALWSLPRRSTTRPVWARCAAAGLLLTAALATSLSGCGSDQAIEEDPQLSFNVDGTPKRIVHEFAPDTTNGQLQQESTVRIFSTGKVGLQLKNISFVSQNKFIKEVWPSGKPTFPTTLAPTDSLTIKIQFKPSAGQEDNNGAVLTIQHNDPKVPGNVVINFKIKLLGPKIATNATQLTFVNPSKAAPPTQCVKFGNEGNAPLVFKSVFLGTATPYYKVISSPNEGDSIAAIGEGDNPKANPKLLEICVRLTPEGQDADYATKLLIETNDPSTPQKTIPITVKYELDNKFTVTCSNPNGDLKFDFSDVTAGAAERCCNIYNDGPGAGFLVNGVDIKALTDGNQELADALFDVTLYALDPSGEKKTVTLPRSISPGKSLDFCTSFAYPADGKTTGGEMVIRYSQSNQSDTVQIPVVAGKCETPNLVIAPIASPVWLNAKVGAKSSGQLVVANQSCAPLQVIGACVSQVGGLASNPCGPDKASPHFKLSPDVGLTGVPAWGLLPLNVVFEPKDNKYPEVQHYLHIDYCGGAWDGAKCSEPLASVDISVTGLVAEDVQAPKLSLALAAGAAPMVGQPFKVEAAATAGALPIGQFGAYLWFIAKRPANSLLWLSTEFQSTDSPWVSIKPDVAGKYTIIGAVQAVDDADSSNVAWSQQVLLEVDVAPKAK